MNKKQKTILARIIISAVLLGACIAVSYFTDIPQTAKMLIHLVPYLIIGYDVLIKSCKNIAKGKIFNEKFLMTIATIGAFALGEYAEGAAVMLFYQLGELFESVAVGKSRRNISALMDIRPDYATVEKNGEIIRVNPDEVDIGSEIIVKAGEKIPIDGVITSGSSSLNTAALTGESLPREVEEGAGVQSGCINMTGLIKIKTTKKFAESTASKIFEMIESAGEKKSRSESFIKKFARHYTPAVCIGALALAVLAPFARILAGVEPEWGVWVMRALTFLVISCPCALVISIPLSFFAAIGGAGRYGILIKGSAYVEKLSKARRIVLDKTGTLTKGAFEIAGIHHNTINEDALIEYAALAESGSNHPIAKCIKESHEGAIDKSRLTSAEEISGFGVKAVVDGKNIAAGNEKLMEKEGTEYRICGGAGTAVHIAVDGKYAGHILISDTLKPSAKQAVEELKKCGVTKIVMLTGDGEKASREIAEKTGVDELYHSLLPADKLEKTEQLLAENNEKDTLVFAGDGLNDAPSLRRADVGIAMGALGQDAAIEAADVVIMDDEPLKIPKAIRISKKCMRIVYENIVFAIGVKAACLLLAALGIANMWVAVFADVGVMVISVLNAVRTLKIK